MPSNYCVYAHFGFHVALQLNQVSKTLLKEFGDKWSFLRPQASSELELEPAHITVMYGPEHIAGSAEAKTESDARNLLGGLEALYLLHDGILPEWATIQYRGVSHFDRRQYSEVEGDEGGYTGGQFVIKAEFESPFLTAVREDIWKRVPSLEARRIDELKALRANGDDVDATFERPCKRWAHSTLFVAKPETPPDVLLKIEDRARTLLYDLPSSSFLHSLVFMTADSWKPIRLL